MDLTTFGTFLRQRRTELGLTQAELAHKLNVTDKAISRWERGKGYPEVTLLEPLAKALGLSLVELMQSKRIDGDLTKEEASAAAAGVLEISQQPKEKQPPRWFPAAMGLAAFFAVVALGLFLTRFLTVPTWMLTRWNPDFTVNQGFADWYAILDQDWSSMEYTAYENGQVVETTRFWNGLDGAHRITHTDPQGTTYLYGSGSFGYSTTDPQDTFYEIPLPSQAQSWIDRLLVVKKWENRILSGSYQVNNDRMVFFQVSGKEGTPVKQVELEHNIDTIGQELLCQRLLDENGNLLAYQRYGWNQYSQCTQVSTYDSQDHLTEQTSITFQDQVGYGVTKSASGELLGTSKSWFTLKNDLKRRETYDPQGQLIGVETYHHRLWERFLSTTGFGILAAMWGIGGFLGIEVYLELKKKQEYAPEPQERAASLPASKAPTFSPAEAGYDLWPYKLFCICFLASLAAVFLEAALTWEPDTYLNLRASFWLDIAAAIGIALAVTLPATWFRKRKKRG